ncbi:hypothetical protein [Xylanibacter caecicola]|uniref:hypothetical protein n=1 Tax=Xylanibacter caecicola TaxID=2736294 RepID=UPI00258D401A|nr:hypothetical protein [Xylanibacter caecicola]
MSKRYIKPSITVIEVKAETLLQSFSREGNGGVGITPGEGDITTGGDADAKEDGGNNIWDDTDW